VTSDEAPPQRSVSRLAAADALALIVFVLVGIRSHHEVGALDLFLRNAVPLLSAWFIVATFTDAYRRPRLRTLLITWAIAVPAGLVARSLWVGSPTGARLLVFLCIGLVFTALFLLAGRALARLAGRRMLPVEPRT
jgi:hypothetical protein